MHSENENPKVSFICCVWNEFNRAPAELNKLLTGLDKLTHPFEIIIVDNYSTDGTREWIGSLQDGRIVKVLNERNLGKGGSIREGISRARGDIGVIYDLDGEYIPDDALVGIEFIGTTEATVSLASRTLGGRASYIYFGNYIGAQFITAFINLLFGAKLTDTATGLKILRLDFFRKNPIQFSGFNVDFEIVCLALKRKKRVTEYQGHYFPRSKVEGKKLKAIKDGLASVVAILHTYLRK